MSEISTTSKTILSESTTAFCLTCLSTTRKLYPIEDAKFFACLTLLRLAEPSKFVLCWECSTYVKKAKLFRQKALQVHVLLNRIKVIPQNTKMSSLVHKTLNHVVSIAPHSPVAHTPFESYPEVETEEELRIEMVLKKEPEEECGQSDQELKDPLATSDDMDVDEIHDEPTDDSKDEEANASFITTPKQPIPKTPNQQIIKLIRLPPGPIPKHLKPLKNPPNIIKCITEPPKKVKNTPLYTAPKKSEPPSAGLEYIEVQRRCTIRALTDEKLFEEREKRLKEAYEDKSRYFCEMCAVFFKSKINLIGHMKKHELYRTGPFECNICGMKFEKEDLFKIHNNTHYRIIICNACSEEFSTYDRFLYHYNRHHDDTPVDCKICGLTLPNRATWKTHVRSHSHKLVECPVCQKMVRKAYLNGHAKRKNQKMPRSTVRLAKSRTRTSYVTRHLMQSVKHVDKKLKCKQCDREFNCLTYLKSHEDRVHSGQRYTCKQCQQKFTSSRNLSCHVLRAHENWRPPKDKVCELCGKAFTSMESFAQHKKIHLNIRPYKCKHCGDAFSYSGVLHTHVKLKHKKMKRGCKKSKKTD